jgi:hypothetical protein
METTETSRYVPTIDWRLRSVGLIGEMNDTFIDTFPATFIKNVDLVEVYSILVCVTLGGITPFTEAAPIQVYAVPSTLIKPAHAVTEPAPPETSPGCGPLFN